MDNEIIQLSEAIPKELIAAIDDLKIKAQKAKEAIEEYVKAYEKIKNYNG
jgi:hypothetical protein